LSSLELISNVTVKPSENDVVLITKYLQFEGLVPSESIADQDSWPVICSISSLWIEYPTKPV